MSELVSFPLDSDCPSCNALNLGKEAWVSAIGAVGEMRPVSGPRLEFGLEVDCFAFVLGAVQKPADFGINFAFEKRPLCDHVADGTILWFRQAQL